MTRFAEAGIVHLRLIVPTEETERVLQALEGSPAVVNLVRLPGSSLKPAGDLVLCDVAREEVSVVIDQLTKLGVDRAGSISIAEVDSMISTEASRAVVAAKGSPADAS